MTDSTTPGPQPDDDAGSGPHTDPTDTTGPADQPPVDGPDQEGAGGGTPPPPPPAAQRPLLRRDHDKHLAGVAGGLADYLGIDATIIRVAFVVLTVFGGMGLALYLVGWVALPSPSMPQSHIERWFGRSTNPAALIAVAVGVVILLAITNDGPGPDGLGWGLLLLFSGWLLFRADSRAAGGTTTTAPTSHSAHAPHTPPGTWHGVGGTPAPPPTWTPPPPRPRSILGRLTVGVGFAAVGLAALLDQVGAVSLEPAQYVALGLTITGLGLLVSAWVGRAYGLIGVGFLLVPIMLVLSAGPFPVHSGLGDVSYAPSTLATVEDDYALGIGQLELDLSRVEFDDTITDITVKVAVGQTTIVVPDEPTVSVDAEMRGGEIELFGSRTVGRPFRTPVTKIDEGQADGGRLQLHVDNGFGELVVRRASEE